MATRRTNNRTKNTTGGFARVHSTTAESGPTDTACSGPGGGGGGAVVVGGGAVVVAGGGGDGAVVVVSVVVVVVGAACSCPPRVRRTASRTPTRSSTPIEMSARKPSAVRSRPGQATVA